MPRGKGYSGKADRTTESRDSVLLGSGSELEMDNVMAGYPAEPREPWIDENGFVFLRTGNERRTKSIVERNFRTALDLTAGERRPWVVDARAMTGADPSAWVVITERIAPSATALAILISNATPAEMATWQVLFDALLLPCRLFPDEDSAVAWLKPHGT